MKSHVCAYVCAYVCVCEINAVCCFHFIMFYISGRRRRCNATVDASRARIQEGYTKDTFYFVAASVAVASVAAAAAAVAVAIVCAPSVNEVISAALPTSTLQIDAAAADAP